MSPFETFDHTADVGLRVEAVGFPALFNEAGRGFLSLLVEDASTVRDVEERLIALEAGTAEDLFLDWLTELLFLFETEHLLLRDFDVKIEGMRLEARARGERLDRGRHRLAREIKAVTYHGLRVEEQGEGWLAEVILDI